MQFVKAVISVMIYRAIVEALFNKYSARHEKSFRSAMEDDGTTAAANCGLYMN